MATKFRIGYPYASSNPDKTRESIVVLRPISEYSGFTTVFAGNKTFSLPDTDEGPSILQGYRGGVVGGLLEAEDGRKSIAKKNNRIHGQGTSMQLALVLAACAIYGDENVEQLPLILCSAAIQRPVGAPPFLDAKISTYCNEQDAQFCLVQKYKAAGMADACALVLPRRDAQILSKTVGQPWHGMEILSSFSRFLPKLPKIIGVEEKSLPQLAEQIGISSYHFGSIEEIPKQVKHRVFVGYTRKDRFIAETICEVIEDLGYSPYLDEISDSEENGWKNTVREKMEKSLCMVTCVTPRLEKTERLKYHLQQAQCRYIPIIPLIFEEQYPLLLDDESFFRASPGISFIEQSKKSGCEQLRRVLSEAVFDSEQGIFCLEFPSQRIVRKLKVGYTYSIGRDRSTYIQFPQEFTEVSRRHVLIDLTVMPPMLIALGRNGTYLNGKKIEKSMAISMEKPNEIRLAHYDKNVVVLTPIQENVDSYSNDLTQTHVLTTSGSDISTKNFDDLS